MLRGEKWTFASHGPPYLICTKLFYFILAEKAPQYKGLCGHWQILTRCLVNVAPVGTAALRASIGIARDAHKHHGAGRS